MSSSELSDKAARLDTAHTALLVIDLQRDFLDPQGYAARAGVDVARLRTTIAPVRRLLAAARTGGTRVIFTREGHRSGGLSAGQAGAQSCCGRRDWFGWSAGPVAGAG
jgi:nicotinamidase-related amidase